jgi:ankyrin repeat protein
VEQFIPLQRDFISELVRRFAPILDINWRPHDDDDGQTPLMRAICDGGISTVQHLLDLRAGVNSRGGYDRTPLMCAVKNHKVQCVKMLIEAGADVTLVDEDGVSALYLLPPNETSVDVMVSDSYLSQSPNMLFRPT